MKTPSCLELLAGREFNGRYFIGVLSFLGTKSQGRGTICLDRWLNPSADLFNHRQPLDIGRAAFTEILTVEPVPDLIKIMRTLILTTLFLIMTAPALGSEIDLPEVARRKNELQIMNPKLGSLFDELAQSSIEEQRIVPRPEDRTRVRLQTNQQGRVLEDAPCALLIHGLFNSPVAMEELEVVAFERGAHVINLRLPGHHEFDPTNLDHVSGAEWVKAVERAFSWAHSLSREVFLAGHSTGGLLVLMTASRHPDSTKQSLVLAPALGLSPLNTALALSMASLGLSGADYNRMMHIPVSPDQDYTSSFAAREVLRLAVDFRQSFSRLANLVRLDLRWFDTEIDDSVDLSVNDMISGQIGLGRRRVVFERPLFVKHEDLTGKLGASGPLVLGSWSSFFDGKRP